MPDLHTAAADEDAPITHYKQTKFYLKERQEVKENDKIFGIFKCLNNSKFKIDMHMSPRVCEKNKYYILHF
jgi:hypothetical protein